MNLRKNPSVTKCTTNAVSKYRLSLSLWLLLNFGEVTVWLPTVSAAETAEMDRWDRYPNMVKLHSWPTAVASMGILLHAE